MATSAANERVFSMDEHVVNSRRASLRSSFVNDILFLKSALKARSAQCWLKFHIYLTTFFKNFCWFWIEHWISCYKHNFQGTYVFQGTIFRRTVAGAHLGRKQRGVERVRSLRLPRPPTLSMLSLQPCRSFEWCFVYSLHI